MAHDRQPSSAQSTTATAQLLLPATETPLPLTSALRAHAPLLLRVNLCLLLVNCKPSEPFLSLFLTQDKGLTEAQLDEDVWPYDTYGAFAFLLPLGYLAEVVGYRSVIALGLLCREATRVLLLFGSGVGCMALMQLTYAAATGATTVYYAYVLTAVSPELRAAATSCAFVAYHAGNVAGSALGSVLRPHVPLRALFYVSWGFTSAGLLACLLLPPSVHAAPPSLVALLRRGGPRALAAELRSCYAPGLARLWLLWWCTGYAAKHILGNYYQMQLLPLARSDAERAAFGYVEAAMEGAMVAGSLCAALAPPPSLRGDAAQLACGAALLGGCVAATLLLPAASRSLGAVAALNAAAMGGLAFQQARGTVAIGAALRQSGRQRFAVVLTSNSFAALGGAMVAQQVASALHAGTAAHYWLVLGLLLLLAAACALVLLIGAAMAGMGLRAAPRRASRDCPLVPAEVHCSVRGVAARNDEAAAAVAAVRSEEWAPDR